ncbi:MAG: glycosyltransferase family 1 protein [Candidatus Hydrogenedentes bacterium]|nr:glycosyltransferase family 1 protein [Candidatus Hydrogenedentota bacterium]
MTHAGTPAPATGKPLKIVIFPLGFGLAHVGRTVVIARALRDLGHDVVFAGEDPDHPRSKLDHAIAAGFRVVRAKEPQQHWAWDRFHDYGIWITLWDVLRTSEWAPLDQIVDDIIRVCHEEKPDLILGDASVGVSTAGHILGIPAAGVLNSYNAYFIRPWRFHWFLVYFLDRFILAPIRKRVYVKYGVKPVCAIRLLQNMPLLSPDLEAFHTHHPGFAQWQAIGPIVAEPPCELPPWFDELSDGTPNIYITMGSTGLLEGLLRRSYALFATAPYRFIVTTGGQVSEACMAEAPANFRFATYAPGSKLLEHCEAMVYHGGNGSMYQALAAGVPMVALPSHLEQKVCTLLLKQHGFGLIGSGRHTGAAKLLRMINEVVENPEYRTNARRFSQDVLDSTAASKAAKILIDRAYRGKA